MRTSTNNVGDIALHGTTIRHHLLAAKRHQKGYHDHRNSAAQLLMEVKRSLKHGEWLPWLKANEIAESTAQRLIQEYANPGVAEVRQEKDRARQADFRAAAKSPRSEGFRVEPSRTAPAAPRADKAPVIVLQQRKAVDLIKSLDAEKLQRVIEFIQTL